MKKTPLKFFAAKTLWVAFALLANAGPVLASENSTSASGPNPASDPIPVHVDTASQSSDIPIENINSDKDLPARTLYLKMAKVEGAREYELQIRPFNRSWAEPFKLKTPREKVRFRVTPGHYTIRSRSLDQKNHPGRWAEWKEFWVPFKQPLAVFPGPDSEITPKGSQSERLTFEWPVVPTAKAYRVKLYDDQNRLFRHVVTRQNWLAVTLDINRKYSWSLKPLVNTQEPEHPGDNTRYHFTITAPEKDLVPIQLRLTERPHTIMYQFELVKMLGDDESSEPTIYESREALFKSRLAPAEYELRVRSVYDNDTVSAWGVPTKFWVRIPPPKLETPVQNAVIDPSDDLENKVELEWEKSKFAEKYQIFVYDEDGKLYQQAETSKTSYTVLLPDNRKYSWKVRALLPREAARAPAATNANSEAFKIDKYILMSLSESEEPSQLFAWGRTIMSNTKYLAENYDNNNRVSQPVFASTGELAAGYWHRKTKFGALVLAGLSGINVSGNNAFYNNGGVLLGYRGIGEGHKRWRLWAGPAYKETPEIQVNPINRAVEIRKISNYGPQVLAAFLDAFNEKWGYQTYAGAYYGAMGLSTPNGLPQDKFLSYNVSGYLTYKFDRQTTGLFGYTYQADEAGYGTTDASGKGNHVYFNGHYLSFSLIWGLQDPQK